MSFSSCHFIKQGPSQPVEYQLQIKGYFIQAIAESRITITDSSFENSYSLIGGALYLLGDSSADIKASTFDSNGAKMYGGAIAAESFKDIFISDDT